MRVVPTKYRRLGVATQAAEIQIEQADIALANTLDTIRATGSGAGGATALAQAALQSKKGVAASIEQQEAQNEKLKAQHGDRLWQRGCCASVEPHRRVRIRLLLPRRFIVVRFL